MPDTAIAFRRRLDDIAATFAPSTSLQREPALVGFLMRKVIATGRTTDRAHMVEACKAELDWSIADWSRLTGFSGLSHDYRDGAHPADIHRLPHERAAATVLNCWGHLHPTEWRIREIIKTLRAQRKAAAANRYSEDQRYAWGRKAEATRDDLRLYVEDHRRQTKLFFAAVAEYRALRSKLDISDVVA